MEFVSGEEAVECFGAELVNAGFVSVTFRNVGDVTAEWVNWSSKRYVVSSFIGGSVVVK